MMFYNMLHPLILLKIRNLGLNTPTKHLSLEAFQKESFRKPASY